MLKVLRWMTVTVGLMSYSFFIHYAATSEVGFVQLGFAILLTVTSVVVLLFRFAKGTLYYQFVVVFVLIMSWLLSALWLVLERNSIWIYFIQNIVINVALAVAFGYSLLPGQQPLISRLHIQVHGTFSPDIAHYTRQVTLVWTAFFIATVIISATLFIMTSFEIWSLFANVFIMPLAILLFTLEYLVRLRRLPNEQHHFFDGIDVYFRHPNP